MSSSEADVLEVVNVINISNKAQTTVRTDLCENILVYYREDIDRHFYSS